MAQQTRVEDLLDQARRDHPEIDPYFVREIEPVFVKNLESVQGDERDVILFSVCYGPDRLGKMSMMFGPLNRDGGERRLNVAITRSRRQVLVFASFRSDQIDLARSRSVGVRHLKAFLEYAEKGVGVLGQALLVDSDAETESPFEDAVKRDLEARGFEVVPQVGCSGYRVDLGIKDPERPGRFLLGVECDGAMYHSAKTARDRDRSRAHVLRGLGWRLHRVWSTDWWLDPAGELAKIEGALDAARHAGESEQESPDATGAPGLASAPLPESSAGSDLAVAEPEPVSEPAQGLEGGHEEGPLGVFYQQAVLPFSSGQPEEFYQMRADPLIVSDIRDVVDIEAPIQLDLLCRRVAAPWGLKVASKRLRTRVKGLLGRVEACVRECGYGRFVWRNDQDPTKYEGFRITGPDGAGNRSAKEIAPEEFANAASAVLRGHVRMPRIDLQREAGRALGFGRMGKVLEDCAAEGVDLLLERGDVVKEEGEDGEEPMVRLAP
jgi:very-short-patch-repair endonuclease